MLEASPTWATSPAASAITSSTPSAPIVSNAEILRLIGRDARRRPTPSRWPTSIIRTAVEASAVARRLIDFTRVVTAVGPEPGRARSPGRGGRRRRAGQAPAGRHLGVPVERPSRRSAGTRRAAPRDARPPARQRPRGDPRRPGRTIALSAPTRRAGLGRPGGPRHRPRHVRPGPAAGRRAVLHHQAGPLRRRPEHRQRHLATASRDPGDPQPGRARGPRSASASNPSRPRSLAFRRTAEKRSPTRRVGLRFQPPNTRLSRSSGAVFAVNRSDIREAHGFRLGNVATKISDLLTGRRSSKMAAWQHEAAPSMWPRPSGSTRERPTSPICSGGPSARERPSPMRPSATSPISPITSSSIINAPSRARPSSPPPRPSGSRARSPTAMSRPS